MDALVISPRITYVFSAFFAFSSARELFKAARAASAPAVTEAGVDDVADLFETVVVGFFVGLKDLPNIARKPACGLLSTLTTPLFGFAFCEEAIVLEDSLSEEIDRYNSCVKGS
jgi:hypothetical protein